MANGWGTLGAVLGGGGQLKQQAYQMGMTQGAQSADLLEQAVERRNKNLALAAVTPEAIQSTDPNGQASLLAALLKGGIDPRQLSGYQTQEQALGYNNSAMAEALKPTGTADQNLLNRELAVISGKPVNLSNVQDGVTYNPQVTPDQNRFAPTDIGQALIGADNARSVASYAQAGASNAAAGEHSAHAQLFNTQNAAGGFNPHTGDAMKPTLAPESDLAAALGVEYDKNAGVNRVPPAKVQGFLSWQAQQAAADSRYNNGAFALQQYALRQPLGSGMNDTPGDVTDSPIALALTGSNPPPATSSDPKSPGIPSSAGAASKTVAKSKSAPAIGTVKGGYMFKGGDPANAKNWIPATDGGDDDE